MSLQLSGSQLHGKVDFERWQKVPKITHTLRHNSHAVLDGYARERTREREKEREARLSQVPHTEFAVAVRFLTEWQPAVRDFHLLPRRRRRPWLGGTKTFGKVGAAGVTVPNAD